MQDFEWWWVIAGALAVVELLTGTFYVLVLAIAAVAASLLAKMGLAMHWQVLGAALVALIGWYLIQRRKASTASSPQELDVGEWIEVESWADGVGSAQYRGAHWSVEPKLEELAPDAAKTSIELKPGKYRIHSLRGNRLIVDV